MALSSSTLNPSMLLLLAAGKSSRMGMPKGLVEFEGIPWLEAQLECAAAAGVREAVIVLGAQHEAYYAALPWLEKAQEMELAHRGLRLQVVLNPAPELGQFSSLQTGCRALTGRDLRGAFILPVDVPCPEPEVWWRLAASLTERVEACVPEWAGRGGHPVLLARRFLERLPTLPPNGPDSRLDAQIHALPAESYARVHVEEPRIGLDLNTPQDLERFRRSGK